MVTGQVYLKKFYMSTTFRCCPAKAFCQPNYKVHFNGAAVSLMMTLACIFFFLLIKSHKKKSLDFINTDNGGIYEFVDYIRCKGSTNS